MKREARAITVFCGSRDGGKPVFRAAATAFGEAMAKAGFDLVYGGAANGLMGALADAVAAGGRKVIGVIPKGLDRVEFAHPKLTERIDVASMHERKAIMAERGDAFVALPGGFGTMDELFEALTWRQIAIHDKPLGLLDVDGYYAPLVAWLDRAVSDGFAPPRVRDALVVDTNPASLLARLFGGA
ncbi:MAG: TIGR00730 family Rossman fold protein [Archangium sp.]|nr:TIGR00730 family Rossman fold protein [Archangium sp.]